MPTCTRILSALSVALLLATGASVADAANLGFLRDTPISRMSQADFDSLTKAVRVAVDEKQDGESTTWTNEGRRNSASVEATITATKTEKDGDRTCRAMEVVISARMQSMTLRPRFCRAGAGAWVYQHTH
jgi:surface antigen